MTDTTDQPFNQAPKPVRALVSIVQIFLTASFLFTGWIHLSTPIDQMHNFIPWFIDFPDWSLRAIGVLETVCALALFFPTVLRIKPGISIIAAGVLTMAMFVATSMHFLHKEYAVVPYPAVLAALSCFVALMRMTKAQVKGR